MRKEIMVMGVVVGGLLLSGCSQKEVQVEHVTTPMDVSKKIDEKRKAVAKKADDLVVEVKPVVDNKLEVVTKVKPEIAVIATEKVKKGEIPVVVVDPVEEGTSVKEVDILPVVDNTVGVVTKVKPTIEVVEEIPVEDESAAVVVEPVVE